MALGVRPDSVSPRCAPGASAQWHPLRSILPPVNAIVRADHASAAGAGGTGQPGGAAQLDDSDIGGDLMLEAGIAPFLAKMKALLDKHPEWRISQLDPHLMRLIQEAITLPPSAAGPPREQQAGQERQEQQAGQVQEQQAGQEPQATLPAPQDPQAPVQSEVAAAAGGEQAGEAQQQQQQQNEEARQQREEAGEENQPEQQAQAQEGGQRQQQQRQEQERAEAGSGGAEEQAVAQGATAAAAAATAAAEAVRSAEASGQGEDVATAEAGAAGTLQGASTEPGAAGSGVGGADGAAAAADGEDGGGSGGAGGGDTGSWRGPRPQEHLLAYCRMHQLPEPCYSLVVKKSARRPLVTASCILPHLGVQVTPDMHVPGGMHAACQAAALAAILWLEGALPADGGEAVRVVPVGWPPLLSEARGESWEAAQLARRAGARRELDLAQREALLREMDKKRQRLVAEAEELGRLMAALRGGEGVPELDLTRLTASLGLGGGGGGGGGGAGGEGPAGALALPSTGGTPSLDGADGAALAGSVTLGMKALRFRSGSGSLPSGSSGPAAGAAGRAAGRAPGTKRPRDDGAAGGADGAAGQAGAASVKSVVMELKELCDRRRWPQPQYSFGNVAAGPGGGSAGPGVGATAVVSLPTVAGLSEFNSGPQSNRKRAKEAAAAAALEELERLGLK